MAKMTALQRVVLMLCLGVAADAFVVQFPGLVHTRSRTVVQAIGSSGESDAKRAAAALAVALQLSSGVFVPPALALRAVMDNQPAIPDKIVPGQTVLGGSGEAASSSSASSAGGFEFKGSKPQWLKDDAPEVTAAPAASKPSADDKKAADASAKVAADAKAAEAAKAAETKAAEAKAASERRMAQVKAEETRAAEAKIAAEKKAADKKAAEEKAAMEAKAAEDKASAEKAIAAKKAAAEKKAADATAKEEKSTETKAVETKPVETKAAEIKPVETKPAPLPTPAPAPKAAPSSEFVLPSSIKADVKTTPPPAAVPAPKPAPAPAAPEFKAPPAPAPKTATVAPPLKVQVAPVPGGGSLSSGAASSSSSSAARKPSSTLTGTAADKFAAAESKASAAKESMKEAATSASKAKKAFGEAKSLTSQADASFALVAKREKDAKAALNAAPEIATRAQSTQASYAASLTSKLQNTYAAADEARNAGEAKDAAAYYADAGVQAKILKALPPASVLEGYSSLLRSAATTLDPEQMETLRADYINNPESGALPSLLRLGATEEQAYNSAKQALEAALKSGGATSGLLDSAKAQWASADTIDTVTQKALRNGATAAATLDNSQKAAIKDLAKVRLEGPQFESMEKDLKTLSSAIKTLQPVPTQASSGEKALKQAATKAAEAKAQWLDSARALSTAQVQSSAASQLYADAAELGAREAALFSGVTNQ